MEQLSILLYETTSENVYVNVYFKAETFWMSQKMMADLFGCSSDNISLHLKNIYSEEELEEEATTEEFSIVRKEGKTTEELLEKLLDL